MQHFLFAWLYSKDSIRVVLDDGKEVPAQKISISDHMGNPVPFDSIGQYGHDIYIKLSPDNLLDFSRNYLVNVNGNTKYAYFSKRLLNSEFYYEGDDLGPTFRGKEFHVKIWSPPATGINCIFFDKDNPDRMIASKQPLTRKEKGIWELTINPEELGVENLNGYYYQMEVTSFGKTKSAIDPYAKSMAAFDHRNDPIGKAAIIDLESTNPEGFHDEKVLNRDLLSNPMEFVGYEMHIRDFTIDPTLHVNEKIRGTYIGAIHQIPHLVELGISHVQLLPVQSCFTVNENNRSYQSENVPMDDVNYNWGYDPHHYFIPNGWYSTNPTDPLLRITEFKTLVQELHANKIGVIIDVVYNHIFNDTSLENIAPGCYLRRNIQGYISGTTGAGSTIGTRIKMIRKLIVDSLKYFKDEFHVNGFRFDLMSFLDQTTMASIREALGEDTILYGEGWEFTDLPTEEAITKTNLPKEELHVGVFNDTCRDSMIGGTHNSGFVQGSFHEGPKVRSAIVGAIKNYPTDYTGNGNLDVFIDEYKYHLFANSTYDNINFLTVHDGFTLFDKLNLSSPGELLYKKKLMHLAFAMLLTSQGRVVIHGGDEFGRSKPLVSNDPTQDRAHTSPHAIHNKGTNIFHENTYRSPDITNMFDWGDKMQFKDTVRYVGGLIQLRRAFSCFRYSKVSSIRDGLRFICENIPNSARYDTRPNTRYERWDEIEHMSVQFFNGPPNETLYLIGEVHPKSTPSKNPMNNPFKVKLDKDGRGHLHFSKEDVANFDLGAWSDPTSLLFKLVYKPGDWTSPEGLYSKLGSNTIRPHAVLRANNYAAIDLSIMNHTAGEQELRHNPYIAYTIDNTLEDPAPKYRSFLVIHNSSEKSIELRLRRLEQFNTIDILADGHNAGTTPLKRSSVKIHQNSRVEIPAKTSTVLALDQRS